MKNKNNTYLSLGTNQGNKLENLQNAIDKIAEKIGDIIQISSVYKTSAWGFNGDDFFNICIQLRTNKNPNEILSIALAIEKELGRTRSNNTVYENRNIDIDILSIDDEIIFSEELIVPHPKMLARKFVLIPFAEIAAAYMHPIEKQSIEHCLQNCTDNANIFKIETAHLKRPIPFTEKYNYIAIEGNIGAGKTSLANIISEEYNTKLILERFAENPFLPKFYENKERYSFHLEMSFLTDRYQQLNEDLAQFNLFKSAIISDYYIFKSLIFAQITLSEDEYLLYRKIFNLLYKKVTKPDLYIYLHQNTERLLENIKKRGRSYEQNISSEYLDKIQNGYINFLKTQEDLNHIIIDVSEIDFVNNIEDYNQIKNKIKV